jgi:hypothetical protein
MADDLRFSAAGTQFFEWRPLTCLSANCPYKWQGFAFESPSHAWQVVLRLKLKHNQWSILRRMMSFLEALQEFRCQMDSKRL